MNWFYGKIVAIFGAAGSIGGEVARRLAACDSRLMLFVKDEAQRQRVLDEWAGKDGIENVVVCDVKSADLHAMNVQWNILDGIVYAVGHCPADGFEVATSVPIHNLRTYSLRAEMELHVNGRLNVLRLLIPPIRENARMVFVSSAITRLTQTGDLPPAFLHAGQYAAAIAAGDELVRYARVDPLALEKGLRLDLIKFGAVDTHFHRSSQHRPPAMISLDEAAWAVVDVLARGEGTDHWISPKNASAAAVGAVLPPAHDDLLLYRHS